MSDDLERFLREVQLSEYHGALMELGVAQPSHLIDAEDEDLFSIGMKPLEVKRLRRWIQGANAEVGMQSWAAPEVMGVVVAQAEMALPEWEVPTAVSQDQLPICLDAEAAIMVPAQVQQATQVVHSPLVEHTPAWHHDSRLEPGHTWRTAENCQKDGCGTYSNCDSANDQNSIAQITGVTQQGQLYTNCCEVLCLRYFGLCGGLCILGSRANRLKSAYSAQQGLVHQPVSGVTACCCPEMVFKQIKREHLRRFNQPLCANEMER